MLDVLLPEKLDLLQPKDCLVLLLFGYAGVRSPDRAAVSIEHLVIHLPQTNPAELVVAFLANHVVAPRVLFNHPATVRTLLHAELLHQIVLRIHVVDFLHPLL